MSPLLLSILLAADPVPMHREWEIEGEVREAILYVPDKFDIEMMPVVFVFHGHGGTARNVARTFNIQEHWPEAIAVYMQGIPTPGQRLDPDGERNGWQHAPGDHNDRDLKFFDAVLETLRSEYSINEHRIYATGHSNGATFTYLLWSQRPEIFAAFAPSAGGGEVIRSITEPRPVMVIAGENDQLVRIGTQRRILAGFLALNGCDREGEPWAQDCNLFTSPTGTPTIAFVHNGTHAFPDEAPPLIVRFFQEHQLSVE